MKTILSKGTTNAKTSKNTLESYILYLAPFTLNSKGVNLCPKASQGCISVCLNTSGRGAFNSVQRARISKSDYYLLKREEFLNQLVAELRKINSKGKPVEVRLNGTSDLDWFGIVKQRLNVDLLQEMTNIQFYDYTKQIGKVEKYQGTRYVQTFSRSENNWSDCKKALAMGVNVAVVFDHTKPLPSEYQGYKVIDGDIADDVMMHNNGVIIGLKAKGKAKADKSGFVVRGEVSK